MGKLQHVQGELIIHNLQNVLNAQDAAEAKLQDKKLKKLEFRWAQNVKIKNPEHVGGILEQLKPHLELESLSIKDYGGRGFPDWFFNSYLSKLVSLELNGCKSCSSLPPLGELASLKELSVSSFEALRSIGAEFYGIYSPTENPFPSLESLKFELMKEWHEWEDKAGAFPCLKKLYLAQCPKLKKTLPSDPPCLKILYISYCPQLELKLPKIYYLLPEVVKQMDDVSPAFQVAESSSESLLKSLSINEYGGTGIPDWFSNSYLSNFVSLELNGCKSCSSLPPLGLLTSLKELSISRFEALKSVGSEFYGGDGAIENPFPSLESLKFHSMRQWHEWEDKEGSFTCLQKLHIEECPNLKKTLPSDLPCLTKLYISRCQQLELRLPKVSVDYNLEFNFESGWMQLIKSSSSQYLRLHSSVDLLPEIVKQMDGVSPALEVTESPSESLLKSLSIYDCPNLESFLSAEVTSTDIISHFQHIHMINCGRVSVVSLLGAQNIQSVRIQENDFDVSFFRMLSQLCRLKVDLLRDSGIFRTWMTDELVSYVEEVEIRDKFELFPPLKGFPNLKNLDIVGCSSLESPFAERASHGDFTSLSSLRIYSCPDSVFFQKGVSLNLTSLVLWGCSQLKSLPEGGLPSKFHSLYIHNCNKVVDGLMQLDLRLLPLFQELTVGGSNYVELPEETLLPSTLTFLRLLDHQYLKCLNYKDLVHLTQLTIGNCPKLQSSPECMQTLLPSLVCLTIYGCPELNSFLTRGLPSKLQMLEILYCDKLVAGLMRYDLRQLPALSHLTIVGYHHVELLPEETLLPSTLTSLVLCNFGKLKSIGLQHLRFLQKLTIGQCPSLQGWPKEKLGDSVKTLRIYGCPLLTQSFSKEEERSKISHVHEKLWV
ncbi:hypothetical protein GH714_001681 [Hevea brasiliensis]|uniref:R13L1/DRL21-like LRR repeat region domain-containing protein n=1 Tax=Hevea brasiliensis TaxID=3981 RepID=A0A6A6LDZ6_HEVBR|nr:hypothetical protein GH714_001681 [Hevea brasiliensis]